MAELNPFKIAQAQLDGAVAILGLDEGTHQTLRYPMRELHVTLPIRMDDAKFRVFHGYRVQYNDARGPTKGGVRFHPDETIDTVRALAAWMTWKTAVIDVPLGGGWGSIACNPKELSEGELERLSRQYVRQVGRIIGIDRDSPAPDVYTTPRVMAWMMDEYSWQLGHSEFGVVTGKPLPVGGSKGSHDATARGGVYAVREACKRLDIKASNTRYAVQGFGNAGQNAALLHAELLDGGCLVGASDSRGGITNPDGIDPVELVAFKRQTGSVVGFPNTRRISNEELLVLDVDVLYPAALENVITEKNAGEIKAKISCELANGPTIPEADRILHEMGVFVIPDFLANAGGVTVSYFEMVQDHYNYFWDVETVHERLDRKMTEAFHAVCDMQDRLRNRNIPMRTAAYLVAIQRVAEAMKLRGWC